MYIWDTEGKKYLDFIGGWAVNSLGHSPEVIKKALKKQADKLINGSPYFYNKPMIKLAKLLTKNSCFDKVFFMSTGAEANECAIKLARKYGQKNLNGANEIITFVNGFHGRTLVTMAATGKEKWKNLFPPRVEGFKHIKYNSIEDLEKAINENTCAIMLEPIQGEGGVNESKLEFIKKIREICNERKILLIFDEIQTGIGRTGKLFAYEHFNIEPDIMTLGKGLGGGYPVSAMLTKNEFNIFDAGDQGGTYTGQPLAMKVSQCVVKEIIDKKIYINAKLIGKYIIKNLEKFKENYNIDNIRGLGLLLAFDLEKGNAGKFVEIALNKGLILNTPSDSTVRLIPPLIVKQDDCDKMFYILEDVFKEYNKFVNN
jgi:acetylornithine/N-succinyldiaminopimelate aminotransferase